MKTLPLRNIMKQHFLKQIAVLALLTLGACTKESLPQQGDGLQHKLTFTFEMDESSIINTKAAGAEDDFIDRLDVLEYNISGEITNHYVWEDPDGLDLDELQLDIYAEYNSRRYFLFMANFDPATVDYFMSLDATGLADRTKGLALLHLGNFRMHKWLMGGTQRGDFTKDEEKSVILYRYVTEFEIGSITADFDDESLMDADVEIKRIVITHTPSVLRPFPKKATEVFGSVQHVYGLGYSYPSGWGGHAFGGVTGGNLGCNDLLGNYWIDFDTSMLDLSQFGATGAMAEPIPYFYNGNWKADKGVLNVDAPGDMRTATEVVIPDGQGIVCSLTGSVSHSISVNKQLYTYPMYRSSYNKLYADQWQYQDSTQKLVIETLINGVKSFYIIGIRELLPNTVYKIKNITLKGLGSDWSNIYVKKFNTKVVVTEIDPQGCIEIDNVDIGVNEDEDTLYE